MSDIPIEQLLDEIDAIPDSGFPLDRRFVLTWLRRLSRELCQRLEREAQVVKALHEYRAQHDVLWRQGEIGRTTECPCGRCIHARAALAAVAHKET